MKPLFLRRRCASLGPAIGTASPDVAVGDPDQGAVEATFEKSLTDAADSPCSQSVRRCATTVY